MDGSVSTTSVASVRQQFDRHAKALNGSASDAAIRTALFEQLLSFSVPVQTMPAAVDPVAQPAEPIDSSESKSEAVDRQEDSEKETDAEPSVTTNIPLAVIDPKQPIQPSPDPQDKNALCSLPPEGKGKAKQDGELINGQVQLKPQETQVDIAQPIAQKVDTASAEQSDQPVADSLVPPVDPNAKPIEAVHEHRSRRNEHETTNAVKQIDEAKPVQAVHAEKPTSDSHQSKNASSQTSELDGQPANNSVQQLTESDKEGRRERWFERDSDSKLPELEQRSTREASSSIDPSSVAIDSNNSGSDTKPVESQQTAVAQNASGPLNPSDAVLASAIVQAQSSPTAVKANAPITADKSVVPSTSDSVSATTTTSTSSAANSKPDKLAAKDSQKTELSQQERVRLVQRIARSFNRISASGGQINLRLHPEQLGALSVQVNVDGKSMSAQLTTETEEARDIILKELPVLKQRLAEQGYDVTKFQVEVAGQGTEANFGQSGGQASTNPRDGRTTSGQMDYRRLASQQIAATSDARTFAPVSLATSSGIDLLG